MALPENLSYTLVEGRFIRAVLDSLQDSDRRPDSVPISGLQITFTANLSPARVKNPTTEPPVTIILDDFTCTTNEDGDLVSPDGSVGVYLVSSDDEDLQPHNWTYTARIAGPSFPEMSLTFIAPSDGLIDLTTLVPVPESPGENLSEWEQAVAVTTANVAQAQALRQEVQELVESVPLLNEDGYFPDSLLPPRLLEDNLIDLIETIVGTYVGGAGSLIQDGGTPGTNLFVGETDGGVSTTPTYTENVDGGDAETDPVGDGGGPSSDSEFTQDIDGGSV